MNVILEKLLENESLDDKDRFEIRQIFSVLSDEKKKNILDNFDKIIVSIIKIKKELRENQEILLGKAISNIEMSIKKAKTSWIKHATSSSIKNLKQKI